MRPRDYRLHQEQWELGEIGPYSNVPDEVYFDTDALSNSALNLFRRSPAHYKWAQQFPRKETKALRWGRAIHMAVLQPEEFFAKYTVWSGERRSKAGKEAYQELVDAYGDSYILSADDYEQVRNIAASVWENPYIAGLLSDEETERELSMLWDGGGILCKSRLDIYHQDIGPVDIKTTEDASPEGFRRSLYKYGYYRQAAFYGMAVDDPRFLIVAVEKNPPYLTAVYRVDASAIALGRREVTDLMDEFAACEVENHWPGYPQEPQPIDVPDYAYSAFE